jgi:PAS domain S-box-containing protein
MDDSSSSQTSRRDMYFEHIPALLACMDEAGKLLRLNARWDGRLGWSREALEGRILGELLREEEAARLLEGLTRARLGEEVELELSMQTRFGTWQPLRWSIRHEERSQLFFGSVVELEVEEHGEQAMYQQLERDTGLFPEELVQFVGSFKRQVYTILNPDGSIRYESPGVLAITGWLAEELVGRPSFDLIHEEDQPAVVQVMARLAQGPFTAAPMTYRFRRRDGSWAWLESDGVTIYRDGVIHSVVLVSREVSEELRESAREAARLEQLETDAAKLGELLEEERARAARAAWAEEAVRTSDDSAIGWALMREAGDAWQMLGGNGRIEPWGELRERGMIVLGEEARALVMESLRTQHVMSARVGSDGDAAMLYACPGSGRDVMVQVDHFGAAMVKEEVELRGLSEQARRALHHELRTPINAILGYTELLEEELQVQHHEDLHRIRRSARLAGAMLSGLLESWRAQGPARAMALERLERGGLLREWQEVMGSMALQPTNLGPRVESEVSAVYTDPHKLRLALFALGYGATRSGRLESIEVRWKATQGGSRDTVCFVARSAGASVESLEREGSGALRALGLGLALRMSEELGGKLEWGVEGDGVTLRLELPQRISASAEIALEVELDPDTLEEMSEAQGDEQPVVLVIDDNPEIHEYLERLLRRQPYHPIFAKEGRQGLLMARQMLPAAILLDVVMPTMDGWSVLAQLKQDPLLSRIPVIIHSILDDRELARQLGAAESLPKPVTRELLLQTLDRVCRRTKTPTRGIQGVD